MNNSISTHTRRGVGRFAFLRWPLTRLAERVSATRGQGLINTSAAQKRYPLRALRYWWMDCALHDEHTRFPGNKIIVADVGCSKGQSRHYIGAIPGVEWHGLDWRLYEEALREQGYTHLYRCDFNKPLPLPDASVDVVIFLHVIEHLNDPAFTLAELGRILRPGGVMYAGSPVAPRFIARVRERYLRAQEGREGKHVQSMDCTRWQTLVTQSGMYVEMLTGAFFMRWSKNPLENYAWWMRLNQLWGALLPAFGGEIYLIARRPHTCGHSMPLRVEEQKKPLRRRQGSSWIAAAAAACIFIIAGYMTFAPMDTAAVLHTYAMRHQDGNDTYYVVSHALFSRVEDNGIRVLPSYSAIADVYQRDVSEGNDPNFFIPVEDFEHVAPYLLARNYSVIDTLTIDGKKVILLSNEEYIDMLRATGEVHSI